ncbi:MAG: hypothetical protein A2X80_11740 [Geobacteraceae bacterium GWB2_52_12]|nr:MAG: hypothetical protein A2X80_11740 [Geobacteraceae bacterium GWB2_52_12]
MSIAGRVAETILNNNKITVEEHLCSRFRTPRSACDSCAVLCPVKAINVTENGVEITGGCTSCGVCVSVCPNGAFRLKEQDDGEIVSEIRARGRLPGVDLFRISCEHGETTADLVVPCLSRLTEVLLMEPLRRGACGVVIMQPVCEECPASKAAVHLETVLKRVYHLIEMVGMERDRILRIRIDFQSLKSAPAGKSLSRRSFFELFRAKTIGIAAASIPDFARSDTGSEEIFRMAVCSKQENRKRSLLLDCLRDGDSWSPDSGLQAPREVRVSSADSIMANIEVSQGCTACGVCATLCPTGALKLSDNEEMVHLGFKPHLCTNCRVCEETCMPKALHLKEEVLLNRLLEDQEIKLFEARKKTCLTCRTDFAGESSDVCPLCTGRRSKQAAIFQF